VQQVRALVLGSDPAVLAARVRLVLRDDVRNELTKIGMPVLYVRGTEDRLVPNQALQAIRDSLPSVVVSYIPAPHFTLQMAPSEAWQAIKRFSEHSGL
jgi:pimeloyl-ACP methyl ester carboxylesterase